MVRQREVIAQLPAYKQGAAPSSADVFKLSSNENPFPPQPSVPAAVAQALSTIHQHPVMSAPTISQRVAEKFGIAQPDVAANLRRVAVPFAVTDLAQRAAVASLDAEAEPGERIDSAEANDRVRAAMASLRPTP